MWLGAGRPAWSLDLIAEQTGLPGPRQESRTKRQRNLLEVISCSQILRFHELIAQLMRLPVTPTEQVRSPCIFGSPKYC